MTVHVLKQIYAVNRMDDPEFRFEPEVPCITPQNTAPLREGLVVFL